MKFITLAAALVAVVPAAFGLTINSPSSVVTCEPTQLNWNGGTAPYYISLLPAGQTSGTPFEQFTPQNSTSYTWNVDLAPGISFTIALKDSSGSTAYSSIITVQSGPTLSCINSSISGGSTATSGATSTPASGSGATTPGATGTSSPTSGSATSTATSGSSTKSSAAGRLSASSTLGVAGIMGLVGAILF